MGYPKATNRVCGPMITLNVPFSVGGHNLAGIIARNIDTYGLTPDTKAGCLTVARRYLKSHGLHIGLWDGIDDTTRNVACALVRKHFPELPFED